jgi:hypothetical protein
LDTGGSVRLSQTTGSGLRSLQTRLLIEIPQKQGVELGFLRFILARRCVLRGELFGEFVRVHRVLVRLLAEFVSAQMIPFAVGDGSRGVGVGRKVMEFRSSIMRAL